MLAFEGCRALVKADVQDRKVFIAVAGPRENRRRLLAVVRYEFERIHASLAKLNPAEVVPVPGHRGLTARYKDLEVMESQGMKEFPLVHNGAIVKLDVSALLNGVDLEFTRWKAMTTERVGEPVRLFYSYAHKDERLRDKLETHLKLLQRQGVIATWHDRKIAAGDDWKQQIDENLERADLILLLVSADFITSDYCYEKEMTRALERHDAGEARVVPVIVRDADWHGAPFGRLQALPKDGKAVMKWTDKDSAWRNVAEGIARVAGELRAGWGRG